MQFYDYIDLLPRPALTPEQKARTQALYDRAKELSKQYEINVVMPGTPRPDPRTFVMLKRRTEHAEHTPDSALIVP